jgi:hypothetical protein
MTLDEYNQQCDSRHQHCQDAYNNLSPKQREYIDNRDRRQARDQDFMQYMGYLTDRGYGSEPTPEPVAPKEVVRYGDAQKLEAGINHLENRVNGLLKMAHSHSKSVKGKYNTYSV